jgi:hypothetical protein
MKIGTSILLIAIGAILRYAVTFRVSGIELEVVGLILIIAGILGLVVSLLQIALSSSSSSSSSNQDRDSTYDASTRRF